MTQGLNLRDLVDTALARSTHPDPHAVARTALMRIPVGSRDDALLIALAVYVEVRIREADDDLGPTSSIASVDEVRAP